MGKSRGNAVAVNVLDSLVFCSFTVDDNKRISQTLLLHDSCNPQHTVGNKSDSEF